MSDAPIGGLRDGCIGPLLVGLVVAVLFAGLMFAMDAQPPAQQPPNDSEQVGR